MEGSQLSHGARKSRWATDALLDGNGRAVIARLTERDHRTFQLLAKYRYLPADYIHALTGGDYKALTHRLSLLSRDPNRYVARPEQQRLHDRANNRALIYELDDRGYAALRQTREAAGSDRRTLFAHQLMICQIAASFEIAAKHDARFGLIDWKSIQTSEKFPPATRELARPASIPLGDGREIAPDWRPFVLLRRLATTSYIFFPGFEADCATEPLRPADYRRSSIQAKFAAYLAIIEREIYRTHFGAQTFMVPFITTSEERMRSMMTLLSDMAPGEHGRRFIFKHVPAFGSIERSAPATDHIVTEPWHRAGFEPFQLTA
jgi:hypothetical protein